MDKETLERYRRYLTNAQVKELAAKAERYKLLNAQRRAEAQGSVLSQQRQMRRGLQNIGLASRQGKVISGVETARNDALARAYNAYDRQLRKVEEAQTQNAAARMVNANIAAQRRAAEEAYQRQLEEQEAYQNYMAEQAREEATKTPAKPKLWNVAVPDGGSGTQVPQTTPNQQALANEQYRAAAAEHRFNQFTSYDPKTHTDAENVQHYREEAEMLGLTGSAANLYALDKAREAGVQNAQRRENGQSMLKNPQGRATNERMQERYGNVTVSESAQQFSSDYGVNMTLLKQTDPTSATHIENRVDAIYSDIKTNSPKWDQMIASGGKDAETAYHAKAQAYGELARLAESANVPAEYRNLYYMTDDEFEVAFGAEEKLYEDQLAEGRVIEGDFNARREAFEAGKEVDGQAIQREATIRHNWYEKVKADRAATTEANVLAHSMRVGTKTKYFYPESYGSKAGKEIKTATSFVHVNQEKWDAVPWADESIWNGQNWKKAKDRGWTADDYAKNHDTNGSRYDALVNEWSYINGRTALLYTQRFSTAQTLNDVFKEGGERSRSYEWFRNECVQTFNGEYETSGTNVQKEQMDAMLTLANLMTDEERARFNALKETVSGKDADAYFEYLYNNVLPQRFRQYIQDEMYDDTRLTEDQITESILSVPANIWQGVTRPIQTMFSKQTDPVAAQLSAAKGNTAQSMRGAIGSHYGEVWNFLYQTGMSMIDSGTVALISSGLGNVFSGALKGLGVAAETAANIGGKAGSLLGGSILGGSAYNSSYDEALQRGLTPEKARVTAFGNGVNEMLFESLSLDLLVSRFKVGDMLKVSKNSFVNWFVNTLVQGGVEGSEEVFTDMANNLWDKSINGILSEELTQIRQYMAEGKSYEEAKKLVSEEYAGRLWQSLLGGAISGGVMGGAAGAMHNVQMRGFEKQGKAIDSTLKAKIDGFEFKDEQMQELQKQGKKTNQDYGVLFQGMLSEMYGQYEGNVQQAVKDGVITKEDAALLDKWQKGEVNADEMQTVNETLAKLDIEPLLEIAQMQQQLQFNRTVGVKNAETLREYDTKLEEAEKQYNEERARIKADETLTDAQKEQKISEAAQAKADAASKATDELSAKTGKKVGIKIEEDGFTVKTKKGSGKVTFDFSTYNDGKTENHNTVESMTEREKAALRIAQVVAALNGTNIKVESQFTSRKLADGTVEDLSKKNGYYDPETDTIHVNLNGTNSVLWTISHELTHRLATMNKQGYTELHDAIKSELTKENLTYSEVQTLEHSYQIDKLQEYLNKGMNLWDALVAYEEKRGYKGADAEEEVVARCCEQFLAKSTFINSFANKHYKTAKSISAFLTRMNADMQQLFADVNTRSTKAATTRNAQGYYETWNTDVSPEQDILNQMDALDDIARKWENAVKKVDQKRRAKESAKAESAKASAMDKEYSESRRISLGMSDADRVAVLRNKTIEPALYKGQADSQIANNPAIAEADKRSLIAAVVDRARKQFDIPSTIFNKDMELDIKVSSDTFAKTVSHGEISTESLIKLMPILESAVNNAIGIEAHENRYFYDNSTKYFVNLLGCIEENGMITPVLFGVKARKDGDNSLYIIVGDESIQKTEVVTKMAADDQMPVAKDARPVSNISISKLSSKVKTKDILKYLPDGFLTKKQQLEKNKAIAETVKYTNNKNDAKYKEFIEKGDSGSIMRMVAAAAKAHGYTIDAYHGTTAIFTVFRVGDIGYHVGTKEQAEDRVRGQRDAQIMHVYCKANNLLEIGMDYGDWNGLNVAQMLLETEVFEDRADVEERLQEIIRIDSAKGKESAAQRRNRELRELLQSIGYDGIVYENTFEGDRYSGNNKSYILFNPSQIKSADEIVYADDGETVVPISERFRDDRTGLEAWKNNDIRYSTQDVETTASIQDSKGNNLSIKQIDYFEKSKVRDKQGRLRPVYHYTNESFTEFRPMDASKGSRRTHGDGYYVSTNPTEFAEFGNNKMVMYANITNPFEMEMTEEEANKVYDKYAAKFHTNDKFGTYREHAINALQSSYKVMDYLREYAEQNGIQISDIIKYLGYDGVHDGSEWVAYDSNQLKSVDNQNPTKDSDTRYSTQDVEYNIGQYGEDSFKTPSGIEVVKNPTDEEYRKIRKAVLDGNPWLRGTGEPVLRRTFDEQGNVYYWSAADAIHSSVEPYINKRYDTRTSQHENWWEKADKDDYPTDYKYSTQDKDFHLTQRIGEQRVYEMRGTTANVYGSSVELEGGSLLNRVRMMQNLAEMYGSVTVTATSEKEAQAFERAGAKRETDTFGDTEYGTWAFEHKEDQYREDTQYDAKQKRKFADAVMKEVGTRKNFTKEDLRIIRARLEKAFAILHNAWHGKGDQLVAMEYADKLFDAILNRYTEMSEADAEMRDAILAEIPSRRDAKGHIIHDIEVTAAQMAEIKHVYGSVAAYNQALTKALGTRVYVKEAQNAQTLEDVFANNPYLDATTNEGDMPTVLLERAQETVGKRTNPYKADSEERAALKEAMFEKALTIVGIEKSTAQKVREAVKQARAEERAKSKEAAQKKKLAEQMERGQYRAKVRREERARYEKKLDKIKEVKYSKDEQVKKDLLKVAKTNYQRLVNMLANPTEASHVPVQLARQVSEICLALSDLMDADMSKKADSLYDAAKSKRGVINMDKLIDAYKQTFADKDTIEQATRENPGYDPRGSFLDMSMYDETLVQMMEGVGELLKGKTVKQMDNYELRALMYTLRGVLNTVYDANKATIKGEKRFIYKVAEKMVSELQKSKNVFGKKQNAITRFLNQYTIESLGLRRIAKLYSNSDENAEFVKLVDDLNEGAIEVERIALALRKMFDPVTTKYAKDMKTWYGKNAEWIDIGNGVKITKGMRVSLAMHLLNEQNLRNLTERGVTIPDQADYKRGDYEQAYTNGTIVKMTKAQAEKIVSQMTEAEKAYFEVAKEFFHKRAGYYINRTSLKMLGYAKAIVENYFPIQVDDAYKMIQYDAKNLAKNASVEHPGFLESRKGTANVMYLNDITAVVNRQINGVAKYAGLAIPMRNWNAVMNQWMWHEDANKNWVADKGNVHTELKKQMGVAQFGKSEQGRRAMVSFVDQFIEDLAGASINNANEYVSAATLGQKLTSNYVKAVLTLNARVALSQLASVPTAAAEIPWKYIVQSFAGNVEQHLNRNASNELIDMYTPLFAMRRAGTQTEVSEVMKRKGLSEKAEQKLPWALGWITAMDTAATRRLWYACERWVKGETDIPVGSDAFYKEVAKRYERVIQNTQPNFTVLQRSPALRSKNAAARIITMFGTQRMQNAGVFIESAAEVIQAKDKATRKAALKKFGRTLSGLVTAAIVIGLERAIVSAIRGRMKPLQDKDKEVTWKSVDKYIRGEIGTSLAGSFMYVGEIYDFVNGIVSGFTDNDTYDQSFALPASEAISEIIKFCKDAIPFMLNINAVDENGKPKYDDHQKWLKTKTFINGLMTAASYATGLPLQNASKTILNGWLPLGQDIADAIKTGEFIPYLNQSGKLDSSKTAANYKEWTNDGKKGSVYLYWENKWKEISNDKKQPNAATLAESLMRDSSLSADDKAQLYRMLYGSNTTSKGGIVYTESGNVAVDFTDNNTYLASTSLSDAKYEGYNEMVADGIPEDLALVSYRQYAEQQKQGEGANDRFHEWLFNTVSDPHQRAVIDMHIIGNTNSVKGDIGYKDGELWRDYSTPEWYELSAINGRRQYTYAKQLTATGMTDKNAIALVKQMKDVKKADSDQYLAGLTEAQKKIIYEYKKWKWE